MATQVELQVINTRKVGRPLSNAKNKSSLNYPEAENGQDGQDSQDIGQRVAVLEERVVNMSREVAENRRLLGVTMDRIDAGLARLEGKIQEVRDQSLNRPTWFTTLLLTALVGLLTGLISRVIQTGR